MTDFLKIFTKMIDMPDNVLLEWRDIKQPELEAYFFLQHVF